MRQGDLPVRIVTTFLLAALIATPALAQPVGKNREHAVAFAALRAIQERSIRYSREYCGLIGRDAEGILRATRGVPGTLATCRIKDAPPGWEVVASFHSHGAWTEEYDDEVPSPTDVWSDIDSQTNGYVGTPGGRVWKFDWRRRVAVQLCGLGCLQQDPNYTSRGSRHVHERYTLDQLLDRFGE